MISFFYDTETRSAQVINNANVQHQLPVQNKNKLNCIFFRMNCKYFKSLVTLYTFKLLIP